jgi:hypothetical protein
MLRVRLCACVRGRRTLAVRVVRARAPAAVHSARTAMRARACILGAAKRAARRAAHRLARQQEVLERHRDERGLLLLRVHILDKALGHERAPAPLAVLDGRLPVRLLDQHGVAARVRGAWRRAWARAWARVRAWLKGLVAGSGRRVFLEAPSSAPTCCVQHQPARSCKLAPDACARSAQRTLLAAQHGSARGARSRTHTRAHARSQRAHRCSRALRCFWRMRIMPSSPTMNSGRLVRP